MKRRVEIRAAQPADEEFLMSLRNDLSVIAAGDSKREADPSWLDSGVIDVVWAPVGYIRLDPKDGNAEVSIALTPGNRDEGLGTEALRELRHGRYAGLPLTARVRRENKASVRAFENAGYEEIGRTDTHIIYKAAP